MRNKLAYAFAGVLSAIFLLGGFYAFADDATQSTLNPFRTDTGAVIVPRNSAATFKLPYLGGSGTKCLHTDNSGNVATTTADCGSGSGGSSATTTINGLSAVDYTFTAGSGISIATSAPGTVTFTNTGGTGNGAFTIGNGFINNATTTDLVLIGTTTNASIATLTVQGKGGINPFAIASSTGTQLLTVTQAGNVGIGTTTPSSLVEMHNGSLTITEARGVVPWLSLL